MYTLPFFIALFLLINPVLLAIFRRLEIQLEKLQFWIMVSSGTAWILSIVLFFFNPESTFTPVWVDIGGLLPGPSYSLDWVSASLALGVCGALFYIALTQQDSPSQNALLIGLGGLSVLGLFAGSAYTLALSWTALEAFHLWIFFSSQEEGGFSVKNLLVVLIRLSAPLTLILLSLTGAGSGSNDLLTDWDPEAGLAVISAGLAGFMGWFLNPSDSKVNKGNGLPRDFVRWIPGALGLMIIVRGGMMLGSEVPSGILPVLLASLAVFISVGSLLLDLSPRLWFLGCSLLAAVSGLLGSPVSGLSWGVVFMLPGSLLWIKNDKEWYSIVILALAGLGVLPFPYFPAWSGVLAFQEGIPGILLAISSGIYLGSAAISVLKNLRGRQENEKRTYSLLVILGSVTLLLSQLLIAYRLGALSTSRGLLSRPVAVWLPVIMIVLVLMLGNWVPVRQRAKTEALLSRGADWLEGRISWITLSVDRLIRFISDLLEGEGGLIWALLIGFLIITLISSRGGR